MSLGRTLAVHLVDPETTRCGRRPAVTRGRHHPNTGSVQRLDRGGRTVLDGVSHGNGSLRPGRPRRETSQSLHRCADLPPQPPKVPMSHRPPAAPHCRVRARDHRHGHGRRGLLVTDSNSSAPGQSEAALVRPTMASAERVLATRSRLAQGAALHLPQHRRSRSPRGRPADPVSTSQSCPLSRIDTQPFDCLGVAETGRGLRGATARHHDRHRRGETERTGAGDTTRQPR